MESTPSGSSGQTTRKKKFGFAIPSKLSNVAPAEPSTPDATRVRPFSDDKLPPGDERPPGAALVTPTDSFKVARRNDRRDAMRKWQSTNHAVFDGKGRCGRLGKCREFLRNQVVDPSSPFNIIIMVVIFVATLAMVLETVTELLPYITEKAWALVEMICVTLFTIELCIKLFVQPVKKLPNFFLSPMNWVDIVAILPFYLTLVTDIGLPIECATGFLTVFQDPSLNITGAVATGLCGSASSTSSFAFLRAIRLARVMRVLKLGNFSAGVKVFTVAIMKSTPQLVAIFFFMMIAMIVFSSMMYYAEFGCTEDANNPDDECFTQKQKFSSIPATMWWCIVTMTTVGYGDMYPTTGIGKIIAVPTMLAGILIFALPITVIGSNYETAYHNEVMRRLIDDIVAGIKEHFKTKTEKGETEEVTLKEVQTLAKKWSSRWTADHAQLFERLEMVWEVYDLELDGEVDGTLTKSQIDKLINDLRMQIDDSVVHQPNDGDDNANAPLVVFDKQNKITKIDGKEGEEGEDGHHTGGLAEDSERNSPAPRQSGRRGSVKSGGRGSAKDLGRSVKQVEMLEARVTSIETQLESQDAAFRHVAEALATLGAALNVSLPPVPPAPSSRTSAAGASAQSCA